MTKFQENMMIKPAAKKSLWNPIKGERKKIYILKDGVMQQYHKKKSVKMKNKV